MRIALDGVWELLPEGGEPTAIRVPGLWEAQGHLDLDGVAWYRRRFELDDAAGRWSLRFGAVMDLADVFVNGVHVGRHESAFTPFELDVTGTVRPGENELAVRVEDPPLGHREHGRTAHGKQGWGNDAFGSPPSLYLTYGGIWQPVVLERHGPVVARDVFVNGDPDGLGVTVDVCNRSVEHRRADVVLSLLGLAREAEVELAPQERRTLRFELGRVAAARWSPEEPVLHEATLVVGEEREVVRFGLRTIRVDGSRLLLNGRPYRMKSALVQGFTADALYAEGSPETIRAEVAAAQAMGFDTLRLHLKAFDPAYLDVCDELGMLLHCDLPIGEPLDYGDLGADTTLARRCVEAAREQVRRDRNHPSIVLWSAMNEVGLGRPRVRTTAEYEAFARAVVAAIESADGTRPVIENDWVEPDPAQVHVSQLLTAHWYGRLHRDWFDKVDRKARRCRDAGRPLLVTELGDWGLPELAEVAEPPFWDNREQHVAALAAARWPRTVESFVAETQRLQGLSDRLQIEVIRRHDHLGGYCVTELTDVPHELNGLLDLHRRVKEPAAAELRRASQRVLPMLDLRSFVVAAGEPFAAELHVSNDGARIERATVNVSCRGRAPSTDADVRLGRLEAFRSVRVAGVALSAPQEPGAFEIELRISSAGRVVATNRYPLRAVARAEAPFPVSVVGDGHTAAALEAVGAGVDADGLVVVGEDALEPRHTASLRARLDEGETVLVLAQPWEVGPWYPAPTRFKEVETRWGSCAFTFTTGRGGLSAFPHAGVVAGEDATFHARAALVEIDGDRFPEQPLVARYNPQGTLGTLVGSHPVGRGRLLFCQFRLERPALAGDVAARALLADLVRLAVREPAAAGRSAP